MTSMADVIAPKSDQINADDLISGPMTITITGVNIIGGQDQPVSIGIDGMQKVYRPCKSMSRVLVAIWGPDTRVYVGRSLTLYRDPEVKWGGMAVGGIRISHMSHMQGGIAVTMALTATKGARKPYTVRPLVIEQKAPDQTSAHQDEARAAAREGTAAFRAWWTSNPGKIAAAKQILPELQELATEADGPTDPFGLPPITDDQRSDAERAARDAAAAAEDAA